MSIVQVVRARRLNGSTCNKSVCTDCVVLFCDTSKPSENITFKPSVILSSVCVFIICRLGAMKIKESIEEMTDSIYFKIVMCLME